MRSHPTTYFVTTVIAERRALLQSGGNASLLCELIFRYRDERRYLLHAFVIMPDHVHAIVTPTDNQSLERCVQCIKGGFSYALGKAGLRSQEIWQRGFHEHRIRDVEDYVRHVSYIARNPERRGLKDHAFVFASDSGLDPMPEHLRG